MLGFLVRGLFVAAFNVAKSGCQNLEKSASVAFVFFSLAVNVPTCIPWFHPNSSPSHLHSLTLPVSVCDYSPLSIPAPRNLILSVSSTSVSSFQGLPNQSQSLTRYLQLSFSASLLIAHLICHHCPHTGTGPLFSFQFWIHSLLVIVLFQAPFWPCLSTALCWKHFLPLSGGRL